MKIHWKSIGLAITWCCLVFFLLNPFTYTTLGIALGLGIVLGQTMPLE